jgi:PadR family transcriptional regulator PadR
MNRMDEKIAAFVKRYLKVTSPEEIEAACERNLDKLAVSVEAMEQAEAEAKEQEWQEFSRPSRFECLVLTAVASLGDECRSSAVYRKMVELTGKIENLGSMHVALDRLERRGLVKLSHVVSTSEGKSYRKRFVTLTAEGKRALAAAKKHEEALFEGVRGSIYR